MSMACKARRRASGSGTPLARRPELHIGQHREPGKQREALEHHGDAVDRPVDLLAAIDHLAGDRRD